MSENVLFMLHFYILVIFSQSFHLFLGYNQRRPSWIADFADSLSDWLVVSLPYSGVYCVYAGRGVYQINRMNSPKVEHVAHIASSTKSMFGPSEESFSLFTGGLSYQTFLSFGSQSHLRLIFVFWSPVYAYSLCILLPWLILKKKTISIFCNCSLMCHNSCFLAHC